MGVFVHVRLGRNIRGYRNDKWDECMGSQQFRSHGFLYADDVYEPDIDNDALKHGCWYWPETQDLTPCGAVRVTLIARSSLVILGDIMP